MGNVRAVDRGVWQAHGNNFAFYDPPRPGPGEPPPEGAVLIAPFLATTYKDDCRGRYKVNADRTFSYDIDCTTDIETAWAPGARIQIDNLHYHGQIEGGGEGFIAANVSGKVQTQVITLPDGWQYNQYRICGSHSNGVRVR
jgi:hypothetical protein